MPHSLKSSRSSTERVTTATIISSSAKHSEKPLAGGAVQYLSWLYRVSWLDGLGRGGGGSFPPPLSHSTHVKERQSVCTTERLIDHYSTRGAGPEPLRTRPQALPQSDLERRVASAYGARPRPLRAWRRKEGRKEGRRRRNGDGEN